MDQLWIAVIHLAATLDCWLVVAKHDDIGRHLSLSVDKERSLPTHGTSVQYQKGFYFQTIGSGTVPYHIIESRVWGCGALEIAYGLTSPTTLM